MKKYDLNDIFKSFKKIGLKRGDLIFLNSELYKLGLFKDIKESNIFDVFYKSLREVIGNSGTICLNTFTFNTLRKGEKFIYEDKKSTSGGFSNYILSKNNVIRSIHPVYSISAIGPQAKEICSNNSLNNFGYNSPYDKFVRLKGKVLNLGMDPWRNPYNHVAEFMIGVPYFYNKFTSVKYKQKGTNKKYTFSTFVRYLDFNKIDDFSQLKKKLTKKKIIKKSKIGSGYIYLVNSKEYLDTCLELLSNNQFALIKRKYYLEKSKN